MGKKKNKNQKKDVERNNRKYQNTSINDFLNKRIPYTKKELLQISIYSLIIVLAAFFLYQSVTKYDIVYCDDNIFIQDLYPINKATESYSAVFEKTLGTSYYRPILNLSFIFDTQLSLKKQFPDTNPDLIDPRGITPEIFHWSNLIYHMLASFLIFLFFLKLRYPILMSFLFSLMVAVHPILTPAAAWISGRNDSLITIFILSSFISMVFYFERKDFWQIIAWIFHIFFFGVALFTKEISAFFPFVAFAYLYLFEKRKKLFDTKYILLLLGQFIMGLIWFFMRLKAIEGIQNPDEIGLSALWENLPTIPALIGKFFVPYKMIALSSFEWFSIATGLVFMVIFTLILIYSKNLDKNKSYFGLIWFFLLLFPTLLIRIQYVDDFFDYAEHRAYLVLVGLLIFVFEVLKSYKIDFRKPLPVGIMAVIIILFGIKSYAYKEDFKNRKTYWSHMTEIYPYKSRGYLDLGKAYLVEDSLEIAEQLYKKGIERNPDNRNLYIDLAALYIRQGKHKKAIAYADTALMLEPGNILAYYNRAKAKMNINDFKGAVADYEQAVKMPKYPDWFKELGDAYFRLGNLPKAVENYKIAVSRNPRSPHAYINMGLALSNLGKLKEAETMWKYSIQLDPNMPQPYINLTRLYFYLKNNNEAMKYYNILKQKGLNIPADIEQYIQKLGN